MRWASSPRARLALTAVVVPLIAAGGIAGVILSEARPEPRPAGPIPISEPKSLPALAFKDAEGRNLDLADFRGKVVLLNVWATWCVPCRKEMPTLDRLQAALDGPGFEVVALSIDRGGLSAVGNFFSSIEVKNLRIYLDQPGAAMRALAVVGLPTTLLLDQDGREIGRVVGPAEWDSPEVVSQIRRNLGVGSDAPSKRTTNSS
jgi:thiol-disulfide isomerase/thioredoxin